MGLDGDSTAVAELMKGFRRGDRESAGKLVEMLYPQLRRLAAAHMHKEAVEHTWQPTALVNELYLELAKVKALEARHSDAEAEKGAFMALASQIMRRLLIRHARPLSYRAPRQSLGEITDDQAAGAAALAEIEDALERLERINPKLRRVVELRVFEGLTGEETAERLACAPATVTRYWHFAREWLAREFATGSAA
jgi:RNA polymerase sigma factor (TIGR02999 family)